MKVKGPVIFSVLILIFFLVFVWEAREWRLQARLYPWAIGIPMIVLCILHILNELKAKKRPVAAAPSGDAPVDFQFTQGIDPAVARQRAINIFCWILGFFLAIYLFGFDVAVPGFVFLYLKVHSAEKWGLSLVLTGAAWFIFWGLFDWLLRLPFPEGVIITLIS